MYKLVYRWFGQIKEALIQPLPDTSLLSETFNGSGIMRAALAAGGHLDIPFDHILKVEEYSVQGNWNGSGQKTRKMSGEEIAEHVERRGGEVGKEVSQIKDADGNVVYDKHEGKRKW